MTEDLFPILPLGGDVRRSVSSGSPGVLRNISIDLLRVDQSFQRAVSQGSVRNIKRICEAFDWAKFLPVIVVEQGGLYSVIDGQHRTIAAATIGIKEVPCYVLQCSPREAAAAFAAINGNILPVGPVDIWFAEVKAGGAEAVKLQAVLDAASVRVTRKKDGMKVGETRSINVLRRAFDKYGPDLLTTILQCITETGEGNPGMIVGAVVNGVGMAIRTKRHLLDEPSRLFDIFDDIDLSAAMNDAKIEAARTGNAVQFIITRKLNEHIQSADRRLRNVA